LAVIFGEAAALSRRELLFVKEEKLKVYMKNMNYKYAPHNDVSVDGPHMRRWSHKILILQYNIIILTIVLQVPTIFNTVTCCTVCSLGTIGYTI